MQCDIKCSDGHAATLNRNCACVVADVGRMRDSLEGSLPVVAEADSGRHANLFSPYALFVDRAALEAMGAVAAAVFEVASHPAYAGRVLGYAPEIARHDPGSTGGVLGLDFHLTVSGPRLIEINTNPGGLLLSALLLDAVRPCAPAAWTPWTSGVQARADAASAWLQDASRQLGRMPRRIAVMDVSPREQFLYPEFELYAQAFRERGVDSVILAPSDLVSAEPGLRDEQGPVDAVYNRLTDFALVDPACATLAEAYRSGAIALTPHPRAHALFADKRNLAVLGDAPLLAGWDIDAGTAERLAQVIPTTLVVSQDNRGALWDARDRYFFKPAAGYGSRGSYRGDKLTRKTWDTMGAMPYVAQELVPPGQRVLHGQMSLKADVRCFASETRVILFAARLYQGQTTNMRTPGGGFAAVLTTRA